MICRHILVPAAIVVCSAGPAVAGDRELLAAVRDGVPPTATASAAAAGGVPRLVQVHYDRARDLQERVRAAAPFSSSCHALGGWTARYAAAEVAAAEALDRLRPALARRLRGVAANRRARVSIARQECRPGRARRAVALGVLTDPGPGAASFGRVVARGPSGADAATLIANRAVAGPLAVAGGVARARLVAPPGRYDLEVRFTRAGKTVGTTRSAGVWLLPRSAEGASAPAVLDAGWQARVRSAASAFPGIAGVWVHDLATGRAAAWNAGARFPAASTVKLGVLVEALRRMGPRPERSAIFHDAQAIAAWSSNLAANRLLRRVGGRRAVESALARMGATSSTYTGPYIVATALPPVRATEPPPRVSARVTTAHDLALVMTTLHDAARGDAAARSRAGLSAAQARLALGLLLSSEQSGDNRGLLRDALPAGMPAAQKQGWISSARHTAAVVYGLAGPVVIVLLTYRPRLDRVEAARLGAALVRLALRVP